MRSLAFALASLVTLLMVGGAQAQRDGAAVQFYEGDDLLIEECGTPRFNPDGSVFFPQGCRPEQVAVARRSGTGHGAAAHRGGQAGMDPNAMPNQYHGSVVTQHQPAPVHQGRRGAAPVSPVYDPHRVDPSHFKENYGHRPVPTPVAPQRPAPQREVLYTPRRIRDAFTLPRPAGCVSAGCDPCSHCRSGYAHPTYPTYAHGSAVEVIDTHPQDQATVGYARLPHSAEGGFAIVIDKRRIQDVSVGGRRQTHYRYSLQIPGGRLALVSTDTAPIVGECVRYDAQPLSARLRVVPGRQCPVDAPVQSHDRFVPATYQQSITVGAIGPGPYLGHGSFGGCQGAVSQALSTHQAGMGRTRAMEQASYVCALHGG